MGNETIPKERPQRVITQYELDNPPVRNWPAPQPTLPSMLPTGRPTRYSKRIADTICDHLRHATSRQHAVTAAGITRDEFEHWLRNYPSFGKAVAKAESEMFTEVSKAVYTAAVDIDNAKGDAKIGIEILKRRDRQAWGDAIDLRKIDTADMLRMLELQQDSEVLVQPIDPGDDAI